MTNTRPRSARRRGSLLILTLLVGAALVFFSLAFFSLYNGNKFIQMRAEARLVAEAAASGGIEDAIYQLKKDATWSAGFGAVRLTHSGATYSMTFSQGNASLPWSTNNIAGSAAVTGYAGRIVPPSAAHLVCVGQYGGVTVTEEALIARTAASPFQFSLFGVDQLHLRNSVITDGYNSANGSYDATKSDTAGNIATNATNAGSIHLNNRARVGGDVTVGPGGSAAVVSGGGTYRGLEVPASPVPVTPPVAPADLPAGDSQPPPQHGGWSHHHGGEGGHSGYLTHHGDAQVTDNTILEPGSYGELTLQKRGTVTLTSGTYVFTNIHSDGQGPALVVASGPVTVYFTGEIHLGQATRINVGGNPSALTLLGTASVEKVDLGQGLQGAFALYAPTARVSVGQGSEIYGALAGRTLDLRRGTAVHFDQALLNGSGSGGSGPWTLQARW